MHVAICDDNIADRKQLERLLKRESDKRAATSGIVYTDSYGNADSMLSNPRQYDVFFLDICSTEGVTVSDLIEVLCAKGVEVPIYLCCSLTDYRKETFPKNVHFIDKPIRVDALSDALDDAQSIMGQAPSFIELRDENNTIYVSEPEILYATSKGRLVTITLTKDRIFQTRTTLENLFFQWTAAHESFFAPNATTIVNGRYLKKIAFGKIYMTTDKTFPLTRSFKVYAKEALAKKASVLEQQNNSQQ